MKSFQRTDRLSQQVQRELADLIQHEMRDPRVVYAHLHKVRVTRDLSVARVYVSALGDEEENIRVVEVLNKAASFLRTMLAQRINIRFTPALRFIFDDTLLRSGRIDKILVDVELPEEPAAEDEDSSDDD